jgi:hypothetical protein
MSFTGPRKIGTLITPLTLRELGMPSDVVRLPEINAAWMEIVGAAFAEHVHPVRYAAGKLMLRASSTVWVSKVRHSHQTLSQALRQQPIFRDLVGLEVRAAPLERRQQKTTQRTRQSLSAATRHLLDTVATDITDPGLRAALERLARKTER